MDPPGAVAIVAVKGALGKSKSSKLKKSKKHKKKPKDPKVNDPRIENATTDVLVKRKKLRLKEAEAGIDPSIQNVATYDVASSKRRFKGSEAVNDASIENVAPNGVARFKRRPMDAEAANEQRVENVATDDVAISKRRPGDAEAANDPSREDGATNAVRKSKRRLRDAEAANGPSYANLATNDVGKSKRRPGDTEAASYRSLEKVANEDVPIFKQRPGDADSANDRSLDKIVTDDVTRSKRRPADAANDPRDEEAANDRSLENMATDDLARSKRRQGDAESPNDPSSATPATEGVIKSKRRTSSSLRRRKERASKEKDSSSSSKDEKKKKIPEPTAVPERKKKRLSSERRRELRSLNPLLPSSDEASSGEDDASVLSAFYVDRTKYRHILESIVNEHGQYVSTTSNLSSHGSEHWGRTGYESDSSAYSYSSAETDDDDDDATINSNREDSDSPTLPEVRSQDTDRKTESDSFPLVRLAQSEFDEDSVFEQSAGSQDGHRHRTTGVGSSKALEPPKTLTIANQIRSGENSPTPSTIINSNQDPGRGDNTIANQTKSGQNSPTPSTVINCDLQDPGRGDNDTNAEVSVSENSQLDQTHSESSEVFNERRPKQCDAEDKQIDTLQAGAMLSRPWQPPRDLAKVYRREEYGKENGKASADQNNSDPSQAQDFSLSPSTHNEVKDSVSVGPTSVIATMPQDQSQQTQNGGPSIESTEVRPISKRIDKTEKLLNPLVYRPGLASKLHSRISSSEITVRVIEISWRPLESESAYQGSRLLPTLEEIFPSEAHALSELEKSSASALEEASAMPNESGENQGARVVGSVVADDIDEKSEKVDEPLATGVIQELAIVESHAFQALSDGEEVAEQIGTGEMHLPLALELQPVKNNQIYATLDEDGGLFETGETQESSALVLVESNAAAAASDLEATVTASDLEEAGRIVETGEIQEPLGLRPVESYFIHKTSEETGGQPGVESIESNDVNGVPEREETRVALGITGIEEGSVLGSLESDAVNVTSEDVGTGLSCECSTVDVDSEREESDKLSGIGEIEKRLVLGPEKSDDINATSEEGSGLFSTRETQKPLSIVESKSVDAVLEKEEGSRITETAQILPLAVVRVTSDDINSSSEEAVLTGEIQEQPTPLGVVESSAFDAASEQGQVRRPSGTAEALSSQSDLINSITEESGEPFGNGESQEPPSSRIFESNALDAPLELEEPVERVGSETHDPHVLGPIKSEYSNAPSVEAAVQIGTVEIEDLPSVTIVKSNSVDPVLEREEAVVTIKIQPVQPSDVVVCQPGIEENQDPNFGAIECIDINATSESESSGLLGVGEVQGPFCLQAAESDDINTPSKREEVRRRCSTGDICGPPHLEKAEFHGCNATSELIEVDCLFAVGAISDLKAQNGMDTQGTCRRHSMPICASEVPSSESGMSSEVRECSPPSCSSPLPTVDPWLFGSGPVPRSFAEDESSLVTSDGTATEAAMDGGVVSHRDDLCHEDESDVLAPWLFGSGTVATGITNKKSNDLGIDETETTIDGSMDGGVTMMSQDTTTNNVAGDEGTPMAPTPCGPVREGNITRFCDGMQEQHESRDADFTVFKDSSEDNSQLIPVECKVQKQKRLKWFRLRRRTRRLRNQ